MGLHEPKRKATVIPPQFDCGGGFFHISLASVKNGKWGYIIDEVGGMTIPYQFDEAGDFKKDSQQFKVARQWGRYINSIGKLYVHPRFKVPQGFTTVWARGDRLGDFDQCDSGAPLIPRMMRRSICSLLIR